MSSVPPSPVARPTPLRRALHSLYARSWQLPGSQGGCMTLGASAPVPDLVKFDIEGFEGEALRGFAHTLTAAHLTLSLELNERLLHAAGTSAGELLRRLVDVGYSHFFDIGGRRPTPLRLGTTAALLAFAPSRASLVMDYCA